MYKTISNEIIRSINSKSNLLNIITDENEELPIKDWVQKYRNVVPVNDIIWLLLRREFLSEKDLRLFAVWCARETLKLIENPDEWSVNACNVAERYANGEATKEELLAARDAANAVSTSVSYIAADVAVDDKSDIALAADRAASTAASYASYAAYVVAHIASTAAAYATSAAVYDATRASQLEQLLTYFE
jgi:hypothetical protein